MVRQLHVTLTQTIREYEIKISLQIAIQRTCNFNMHLQDPALMMAYKVPQNCYWKEEGSQQTKHYRFFFLLAFYEFLKPYKLQNHWKLLPYCSRFMTRFLSSLHFLLLNLITLIVLSNLPIFALIRTVHEHHSVSETCYHLTVSRHPEVIHSLLQVKLELEVIISGIKSPLLLYWTSKFSLTVSLCLRLLQILFLHWGSRNSDKTGCS